MSSSPSLIEIVGENGELLITLNCRHILLRPKITSDIKIKTLRKHNPHDYLIESVELLGSNEKIDYARDTEALKINLKGDIKNDLPICFKIEIG